MNVGTADTFTRGRIGSVFAASGGKVHRPVVQEERSRRRAHPFSDLGGSIGVSLQRSLKVSGSRWESGTVAPL
jgi:hypothetical protein